MKHPQVYTLAFLVTCFPPEISGASNFNWERALWFAKQKMYRVIVFAPDWQKGVISSSYLQERLIVEYYPSKPWLPYPLSHAPKYFATRRIRKRLAHYQPDLIVITDVERFFLLSTWQLPGVRYAREKGIPYLAEYHTDFYNFSAAYPGWQWLRDTAQNHQILSFLYHKFDRTICTSTAAATSCKELGIRNVEVLPFYGLELSMFNPNRCDRSFLESWLSDREKDNKIILFLGRLGFEKRVDLLIQAFALLKRKHDNYSLIIAGNGPNNVVNHLKSLTKDTPDIHFTGFIFGENKANILASCDVFCSPSPYETFGLTIVEAMASGIPVVTVDSGAVSEYVIDGVNGYLVEPGNVEALANCINKVLENNNTEVIQQALQQANQFSVDQGCQNLNNYYQQLLKIDIKDSNTVKLNSKPLINM